MNYRSVEVHCPGLKLSAVAALLLFASTGWATTAPCSSTASLASYGTGDGNGCYEIDQSFTNFSVIDGSNIGTTQTTSTDDITGSSNYSAPTTPFLVYGAFTPAAASDWQATGTGTGGTVQGTINDLVDSQQNFISIPSYPAGVFQIDSVSIGMEGTTGLTSGDSIAVTKTFCEGASGCTTGPSGDAAVLTVTMTSLGGASSELVYGCTVESGFAGTCSPDKSTVDFSPLATLNVTDQYNLTVSGSDTDTLSSFVNFYGEEGTTPEPSSFVLLGTALAAAGLLRLRRKAS
jgi:hypothetical protein